MNKCCNRLLLKIAVGFIFLGAAVYSVGRFVGPMYETIDPDGRVHEPLFGLMPIGAFLGFIGVVGAVLWSIFQLYRYIKAKVQ